MSVRRWLSVVSGFDRFRAGPVLAVLILAFLLGVGPATRAWNEALLEQAHSAAIGSSEFSSLVARFSEEGGYFRSDNFVSNETSYLHIIPKLQEVGAAGGAYIGVGPEQNFTYIAKVRPEIAFIVDVRRQAMIQHLMFKAIFQHAEDRVEFLRLLLSRSVDDQDVIRDAGSDDWLERLSGSEKDPQAFLENLTLIRRTIEEDFEVPLTLQDRASLQYVYAAFAEEGLDIQYRSGGSNWPSRRWGSFPTLQQLILERDLMGRRGNFLALQEDYEFVRDLQRRNRIIPVIGDFAGPKALASVAEYLRENGYAVTAFYTSNVEQYLFANGVFSRFVENVRKLPLKEASLFIRAFPNMREPHPARISGHRLTTILQRIDVFLRDADAGLYPDYWSLVTTNFIAPTEP